MQNGRCGRYLGGAVAHGRHFRQLTKSPLGVMLSAFTAWEPAAKRDDLLTGERHLIQSSCLDLEPCEGEIGIGRGGRDVVSEK